jgi:PAS domain S-box-containing protein
MNDDDQHDPHAVSEAKLRASEERYRLLVETSHDLIWAVDAAGVITFMNQAARRIYGRAPEEMIGRSFFEFLPPEQVDRDAAAFARTLADSTGTMSYESKVYRADGSIVTLHANAVAVRDEQGNVIGTSGVSRDMTTALEAERALRESEERLRELAETIDDAFWSWDVHAQRIIYVSPSYERLFGQSRAELYRDPQSFRRCVHPDDRPRLEAALERNPYEGALDYRVVHAGGAVRWVSVRTFPVRNEAGAVIRAVGVARDITERVEAAEQVRRSEEQYRLLFRSNPHPMWVYDVETLRFLAVNDAAQLHYGYSEQEFLAMTLREIRPPEDVRLVEQVAARLRESGKSAGQWRHRTKDGRLIDVEVVSDAISFDGRPARLVLANNITARLLAEARVREQAELLDKAQDAIIVCNLNHRITYWNKSAERLYGWSAAEALGAFAPALIYQDSMAFDAAAQQLMEVGEWTGELRHISRDGRELIVEGRWNLVRDDAGHPVSILTVNTDVTERKKLEAQVLRAQRMESIGTLAGGMAHDLNNILAPILMSLELLRFGERTAEEIALLDVVQASAQRGADLVRQVLSFSRGAEGRRIAVHVGDVVRELEKMIRETFDRNIAIHVSVDPSLWSIVGDPTNIHQLLLNLCVNARDAMPHGGALELTVSNVVIDEQLASRHPQATPGRYIEVMVADSGIGVPEANRDRIFDPFFSTKELGRGTGLGLPTALAVVKSHRGFITVYSEESHGTAFKVYLPASEEGHVEEPPSPASQLPRGAGELVLVVDDEAPVRTITKQTLEAFGYRVLLAENGAEAVALYATHTGEVAAVLTDMMMPIMDGVATIQALLKINPRLSIIAASGLAANSMVAKAAAAGVTHFLPKPYTAETMLRTLAAVLHNS